MPPKSAISQGEQHMAQFHFLDDTFTGRLGTLVGSSIDGQYYIKRFHKPGNPNTGPQQEVRGLFRQMTAMGRQIKADLQDMNLSGVKESHLVRNFVHLNGPMFEKIMRRQTKDGTWDRWHPEMLQFCSGTLSPLSIESAEIQSTNIGRTITVKFSKSPGAGIGIKLFVYDDDCKQVMSFDPTNNPSSYILSAFENMSTFKNIHVYAIWADGYFASTNNGNTTAEHLSRTAYRRAVYIEPTPPVMPPSPHPAPTPEVPDLKPNTPMPQPAPAPIASGIDEATQTDPIEAAALRDEAARLMAEAQRLQEEANAAGGPAASKH
jgi:hypothetical protein